MTLLSGAQTRMARDERIQVFVCDAGRPGRMRMRVQQSKGQWADAALCRAPVPPQPFNTQISRRASKTWGRATVARAAAPGSTGRNDNKAASSAAAGKTDEAGTSGRGAPYSYHSDGHYKATIEDVFGSEQGATPLTAGKAPWNMSWQANERNTTWNDDLKMRLLTARPPPQPRGWRSS